MDQAPKRGLYFAVAPNYLGASLLVVAFFGMVARVVLMSGGGFRGTAIAAVFFALPFSFVQRRALAAIRLAPGELTLRNGLGRKKLRLRPGTELELVFSRAMDTELEGPRVRENTAVLKILGALIRGIASMFGRGHSGLGTGLSGPGGSSLVLCVREPEAKPRRVMVLPDADAFNRKAYRALADWLEEHSFQAAFPPEA